MFERYRIEAIVFILIVLCVAAWGLHKGSELRREYSQDRQEISSNENARTQTSLEACSALKGPLLAEECRAKAIASSKEQDTSQKDLKVQQDMSIWALDAFVIALITLIIGVGGLIYVARTFEETRVMARDARRIGDDAREIGEKQVRAYLEVRSITIGHDGTNECLTFACKIRNTGQSPAISADLVAEVTLFYDNGTPKKFIIPMYTAGVPVSGAKIPTVSCVDAKLARDEFAIASACYAEVLLFGTDVFGKETIEHSYFTVFGHPGPGYVFRVANRVPIPAPVLSQERLNALIARRVGGKGSNG